MRFWTDVGAGCAHGDGAYAQHQRAPAREGADEHLHRAPFAHRRRGRCVSSFSLSHRTAVHAIHPFPDLIIVLKDGQVSEQGTHDELMRAEGLYYSMWQQQVSDVRSEAASAEPSEVEVQSQSTQH